MKNIIYIICLLSLVGFSCTNGVPKSGSRKINMNDSSMIILEKDSQYLGNIVDDITPKANVSTKQEVSKIIQKVDSAKDAKWQSLYCAKFQYIKWCANTSKWHIRT